MRTTMARQPMMLSWLAKKAGITEHRAEVLWRAAERHAALVATPGTSDYCQAAMNRLLELVTAEALREDEASFGLRRLSRLQAKAVEGPLALLDALSLSVARAWRLVEHSIRPTAW